MDGFKDVWGPISAEHNGKTASRGFMMETIGVLSPSSGPAKTSE